VLFYIALNLGILFSSYKAFTIERVPENVVVLKKDSGITTNGVPKYFVEVSPVTDSTKYFREEISYGFVWDTIDLKEKIVINKIPLSAFLYGCLAFFLMLPVIMFGNTFGKLVLRLRD
jgi:hypothetical protein